MDTFSSQLRRNAVTDRLIVLIVMLSWMWVLPMTLYLSAPPSWYRRSSDLVEIGRKRVRDSKEGRQGRHKRLLGK